MNKPAGMDKKSFALNYHGGEIWCEHLDGLYQHTELLFQKFNEDLKVIKRPSTSSFLAVNLDQTEMTEEAFRQIISKLCAVDKPLKKIVFVGLNPFMKKIVRNADKTTNICLKCIDDYEKAKEWLLP